LIAFAVACVFCDFKASALVNRSRAIANPTSVHLANTRINIVANAICVNVCRAVASAYTNHIELIAFAITIAFRNPRTTAFIHRSRTIAGATIIEFAYAFINVITDTIIVDIRATRTSAITNRVHLVPVTITVAIRNVRTAAFIDCSWTIAHTARVEGSNARIFFIANAIGIAIV
jgi:hypothetical protein